MKTEQEKLSKELAELAETYSEEVKELLQAIKRNGIESVRDMFDSYYDNFDND